MKKESSLTKIFWSFAYLVLIAFVLRGALTPRPVQVDAAAPQGPRKSVEEAFSANPQVRVTKLKIGSVARGFKEEFDESDDWPRKMSLEIQNIGSKPIVYLEVNLNFPETKSSGSMMSYPIKLGIRPDLPPSGDSKSLLLMPGEKLDIPVSDRYDKVESFIRRRHPMKQIHKAQVEIGFIIFEGGTAWAGEFLQPDPAKAGRYIPVGRKPQE